MRFNHRRPAQKMQAIVRTDENLRLERKMITAGEEIPVGWLDLKMHDSYYNRPYRGSNFFPVVKGGI